MTESLYDILGVPRDATPDQIRDAYRRKAKETHPDKGGTDESFQKVGKAFQVLKNPETRKAYDEGRINDQGEREPQP